MPQTYKNLLFTKHAYDRIKQRSVSMDAIYETIKNPDKKEYKDASKQKYFKIIRDRKYQVIATYKSDQKKYLVISAWVRGENDKLPLMWILLTAPFKFLLWIIKILLSVIWKLLKKMW